jgi:hypothetical protein
MPHHFPDDLEQPLRAHTITAYPFIANALPFTSILTLVHFSTFESIGTGYLNLPRRIVNAKSSTEPQPPQKSLH